MAKKTEHKSPPEQPPAVTYEFTLQQNARVSRLASAMQLTSVALCLTVLFAVPTIAPTALEAARRGRTIAVTLPLVAALSMPLLVAFWTFRSAGPLRKIVSTEGKDLEWLMTAIDELTRLYILQLVMFAVALTALLATLVTSGVLG